MPLTPMLSNNPKEQDKDRLHCVFKTVKNTKHFVVDSTACLAESVFLHLFENESYYLVYKEN